MDETSTQANKYKALEEKLAECSVPFGVDDVGMVNFRIDGEKISVLLALHSHNNDELTEENKRIPLLLGVYEGVQIKELRMPGGFDFRNVVVVDFSRNSAEEINITLELYPECRFFIRFSFKKCRWSIKKVVSHTEFWNFAYATGDVLNAICDLAEVNLPEWAKLDENVQ